ncbi:MAG: twin-arginine translocase subunit TatC [Gammaproteobacteria bacterium]|nr:twin-arginine translocase subunit TatC [Gammaproteobacteria bacterium]MCP5136186.1 twin-arginine translocase subunit TatC [Gammaproteobacteria bacterium]
MAQQPDPSVEIEQPFLSHLLELRDRLIRVVIAVLVVFMVLFPFANDLFTALAGPLTAQLPEGSSLIATEVASPFLTPFKLALMLAIYIAMPVILYQAWGFIAPGLYQHEKRLIAPLLVSSSLLYYAGMAFAYFVVFPLVFGFLAATTPEGVEMATDISKYLDFVLTLFFAFGIAFEVPIAVILLVWTGMTDQDALRAKRPYIIVGAFVVGMLLTPPDVISQTLLALPMWLLFEVGLLASGWFQKQSIAASAERETIDAAQRRAEDEEYRPRTEAEMDAELERMEAEEEAENANAEARPTSEPKDDLANKSFEELREMAARGELKEPPISERGFTTEGLDEEIDLQADQGEAAPPKPESESGSDIPQAGEDNPELDEQDKPKG